MVKFETPKTIKDSQGNDISFSRCVEWTNNDPNSCKDIKPKDTQGWIKCAIGSDPATTSCSPYTPNEFSCAWGQECYAVTSFAKPGQECYSDSNNGVCYSSLKSKTASVKTQSDGNLVIYDNSNKAIWASQTFQKGTAPFRLAMQSDGNLVLYDSNNTATWNTNTQGKGIPPYKVKIEDSGDFVVYDSKNTVLWRSNTTTIPKPTFETPKTIKDIYKNTMTISHCTNWPNNDPNTCKNNTPQGTVGWIKCAIGSDPTSSSCSPYTPNEFSCALGQECYAVTSFVDTTTFSDPTNPTCDSTGNKISYSKCTNWGKNDPKSCSDSSKKPQGIVGWMACAIGSLPTNTTGLGCSPISSGPNENTCALAQDCFAITSFNPDPSCKKSGIAAVGSVLSGESLPSSTTIIMILLLVLSIIVAMTFLF